jgi:hypothetical protein
MWDYQLPLAESFDLMDGVAFSPMRPLEPRPVLHRQTVEMIENLRWHEYGGPG